MRVYNTQGIVLDSLAYSEHAIIVRIYTLAYGLHSYLVRGVRKPHSRTAALYQPLVALDMVVSHRSHRDLQYVVEVQCMRGFPPYNLHRQPYTALLSKLLQSVLEPHEGPREADDCFCFVKEAVRRFGKCSYGAGFVLAFLVDLSKYLGIFLSEEPLYAQCLRHHWRRGDALATMIMQGKASMYISEDQAFVLDAIRVLLGHYATHFASVRALFERLSFIEKINSPSFKQSRS